jgi:hypothetical protein
MRGLPHELAPTVDVLARFADVELASYRDLAAWQQRCLDAFVPTGQRDAVPRARRGQLVAYCTCGVIQRRHGANAELAYEQMAADDYMVWPGSPHRVLLHCHGQLPSVPDWKSAWEGGVPAIDVLVAPASLDWCFIMLGVDGRYDAFFLERLG